MVDDMDQSLVPTYQSEHKRELADRILTSTSGNARSFVSDAKWDLQPSVLPLSHFQHNNQTQFLALQAARRGNIEHIIAAQICRQHPEYLKYRARRRQEICKKDNMPVWPSHVEDAFQDALIYHPPIGRKKEALRGKSLGRNQLVQDYIFQVTGVIRCRKQISSHVQNLGKLMKGVKEWTYLTKDLRAPRKGAQKGACQSEPPEDEFMEVKAYNFEDQSLWNEVDLQACSVPINSLYGLKFDMWIGYPEKISHAIHNYTRTPVDDAMPLSSPLENLKDWRTLFPDLDGIIQTFENQSCDIILIKSGLTLMTDFPPGSAQLGVTLELDFRYSPYERNPLLAALRTWQSTNSMYYDGRLQRKNEHSCSVIGPGVVQPAFQVDWWATKFTEMTTMRKEADDDKDKGAVASVDEYSRTFFRGLTMMQEIFATTTTGNNEVARKRMAILLWQFSQVGKTHSGITKWCKLVPPPDRVSLNSPSLSTMDATLPPLSMDSVFDEILPMNPVMDMIPGTLTGSTAGHVSPPSFEVGEYYSGFTPMQITTNRQEQFQLYDIPHEHHEDMISAAFDTSAFRTTGEDAFDFAAPLPLLRTLACLPSAPTPKDKPYSGMVRGVDQTFGIKEENLDVSHSLPSSDLFEDYTDRKKSLANFDVNTHRLLQAQLGDYGANNSVCSYTRSQYHAEFDIYSNMPDPHVGLSFNSSAPDSQSSVIHRLDDLGLGEETSTQQGFDDEMLNEHVGLAQSRIDATVLALENHPCVLDSPRVSRPPLMTHHSWAGVTSGSSATEQHDLLTFDTPTRDDFAHLMTSIDQSQSQELNLGIHADNSNHANILANHHEVWASTQAPTTLPINLYRMHSQPSVSLRTCNDTRSEQQQLSPDDGSARGLGYAPSASCLDSEDNNSNGIDDDGVGDEGDDSNGIEDWTEIKIEEVDKEREFTVINTSNEPTPMKEQGKEVPDAEMDEGVLTTEL